MESPRWKLIIQKVVYPELFMQKPEWIASLITLAGWAISLSPLHSSYLQYKTLNLELKLWEYGKTIYTRSNGISISNSGIPNFDKRSIQTFYSINYSINAFRLRHCAQLGFKMHMNRTHKYIKAPALRIVGLKMHMNGTHRYIQAPALRIVGL